MTQAQFSTKKLSRVATLDAYQVLQRFCDEKNALPYKMKLESHLKVKTNDRFYYSKLIEAAIIYVARKVGADPVKIQDSGKKIKTAKGEIYVKRKGVKRGRADVRVYLNGKMYNLEVKIGNDRMSEEQKQERERAVANGEVYLIIKTLDDVVNWMRESRIL